MTEKTDQDRDELVPVVTMDAQSERRLTRVLVGTLLFLLGCGILLNLLAAA